MAERMDDMEFTPSPLDNLREPPEGYVWGKLPTQRGFQTKPTPGNAKVPSLQEIITDLEKLRDATY